MSTKPKVIFIDWYKTLSTSLFWVDHRDAVLSREELASIPRFLFSEPGLIDLWMKGFTNANQVAGEVAAILNINAEYALLELEYSCKAMELYDPEVVGVVQDLRKLGIKVIIATDNMDTFERWTVPALKLTSIFDGIITSVTRGALKSELQDDYSPFFGHYLGQNGIDDTPIKALTSTTGMQFRHVANPSNVVTILREFL
jgi:FMN phosphatase YigB (HAD superfamily)